MPDFEELGARAGLQLNRLVAETPRLVRRLVVCHAETGHDWQLEIKQQRSPYTSGASREAILKLEKAWYATHPPRWTGFEVCPRCDARREAAKP